MKKPIALVAAMQQELEALLNVFPQHDTRVHFNTPLYLAQHHNQPLVIAQSGVGKANAACTLALLISDFDPACVINTGCAGGLHAGQKILDLVVPEEIVYTDVDVTPLGLSYGQMMGCTPRFHASPPMLARFQKLHAQHKIAPNCHHGLLGSSDSFIYNAEQLAHIKNRFHDEVQCVDMEGGAIAHVCTRFGVPFLILRALSDAPGTTNNTMDFNNFIHRAAANSAELCCTLVNELSTSDTL